MRGPVALNTEALRLKKDITFPPLGAISMDMLATSMARKVAVSTCEW
jgi:hypothetical protein